MKLSKEEKDLIFKKRAEEEAEKPVKIGFAKENLYKVNDYRNDNWFASESEKIALIKDFENYIELSVPKGTEFECYIDNNEEFWCDTFSGLFSEMPSDWAEKYLDKIKVIKRK